VVAAGNHGHLAIGQLLAHPRRHTGRCRGRIAKTTAGVQFRPHDIRPRRSCARTNARLYAGRWHHCHVRDKRGSRGCNGYSGTSVVRSSGTSMAPRCGLS
jgi:hypothetical protein